MTLPEPATYSIREAAELLGIGESTAYEAIRRGEFPVPVLKIGARRKVSRKRLHEFLDLIEQQVPPAEPGPAAPMNLATRIAALSPEDQARVDGFVAGLEQRSR